MIVVRHPSGLAVRYPTANYWSEDDEGRVLLYEQFLGRFVARVPGDCSIEEAPGEEIKTRCITEGLRHDDSAIP